MKTTLKRGIGRGSANGNGRPVLPPETLAPVTRYRQPPRRRRGFLALVARGVLWLLLAALVVAAGLAGGAYLYTNELLEDLTATTPDVVRAQKQLEVVLPGDPATALVIGYDHREGAEEETNGARSDTVMLLRIDPDRRALSMLSFPRDLVVDVVCPGKQPFRGRINEAYSACGAEGTLETVRRLTGVPINYLVTINFRGFKQVVAKLGGVWMDVDRRYYNPEGTGYAAIDLQPGYQKLGGQDALDYVRYRHADSDLYRLARQQAFVKAFNTAVTDSFSPTDVPKVVGVVRDNVEIGVAGGEPISARTLISYGLLAYELPNGHVFQSRIDHTCFGENDFAELHADPACIDRVVDEFTNPDVAAPEKATAVALGKKPKDAAPAPKETTVVVLNGNGVAGAAADGTYLLAQRGYVTLTPPNNAPPNAPSWDYLRSKVHFDPAQTGAEAAARKLAAVLGEADAEPLPAGIAPLSNGAMLVVVLGQTFAGELAAEEPPDATPEPKEAAVVASGAQTEALVREAQARVPFPVLLPTVVERTSSFPSETPMRVYEVAGHETVRFVFATGASEYWGIQMVRWNDAPVLREPNRKLFVDGRRYELHYVGPHLRTVVYRARDGTTYWVVNTILNSLSNETMLAIAKGLKPLDEG